MKAWRLILCLCLCLWGGNARATAPAAIWFGESLLLRDVQSGARGMLWLDPDGRYIVFYAAPHPLVIEGVNGPFSVAALAGRYGALASEPGVKLCLRPDPEPSSRGREADIALFRDAGCVIVPVHPVGETFGLRFRGRDYELVLAQGR